MDIVLAIVAIIFGLIGLLGAVVPVLPGTVISYVGYLLLSFTAGSDISTTELIIWAVVSATVIILDYILPGYFSKLFGGSKRGIMGANIGVFAGIFFGPIGVITGPFIGAFLGELLNDDKSVSHAVKVASGSMLSFLTGTGLKLIVGAMLMYYIVQDVVVTLSDKV